MENKQNPKYAAIENLINVIKNNELTNIEYHISNTTDKNDEILFVKIPLPTNFSQDISAQEQKSMNMLSSNTTVFLEPVDIGTAVPMRRAKNLLSTDKPPPMFTQEPFRFSEFGTSPRRRGFVTRTNVTRARSFI